MGLQQHLLRRAAAWTTSVEAAPSTKRAGGGPSHSCAQISVGRSQRTRSSGGWPRLEGQRRQGQRLWAGTGAAPQPLVGIQATGVSSRVQKAALSKGWGGVGGEGLRSGRGRMGRCDKAVSTVLPRHGTSGSRKSLELNTAKSATLTGPHGCTATSHGALSGSALRPECVVQPWSRESQPQEARLASCGPAKVALSACSGAMTRWQGTRGRRRVPAQASGSSSGSGSGSGSGLGRARLVHV